MLESPVKLYNNLIMRTSIINKRSASKPIPKKSQVIKKSAVGSKRRRNASPSSSSSSSSEVHVKAADLHKKPKVAS